MTIGTPFTDDKPQFEPVWKQNATDENGKRRFHGAFTGGFTAGYYGTVGSKEGFQPRTFKSSRTDRNSVQQRAEDFMDDEDFEQSIAGGKILATNDTFTTSNNEINDKKLSSKIFVPKELLSPVKESIGVKLLRLMGWKPGQAIAPRILPSKRKRPSSFSLREEPKKKRVMGPLLSDLAGDDDDDFGANMPRARKEVDDPNKSKYLSKENKRNTEDFRGIGCNIRDEFFDEYANMRNEKEQSVKLRMDSIFSEGAKVAKKFGQGIFEDTDDVDVYDDNASSNNYDAELTINSKKKKKEIAKWNFKPIFRFFGSLVTEGKIYPAPKIPSEFTEKHIFEDTKETQEEQESTNNILNAKNRGRILGERQLPILVNTQKELPNNNSIKRENYTPSAYLTNRFTSATNDPNLNKEEDKEDKIELPKQIIREEEDWDPNRLLCKRFGEKYPYNDTKPKLKIKIVKSNIESMFSLPSHLTNNKKQINEIKEPTMEELLEEIPQKPDVSIFKAIFEESDEEEISDEEQ